MSDQNIDPIDALHAAGLRPIVLDENTDFSLLPTLNGRTRCAQCAVCERPCYARGNMEADLCEDCAFERLAHLRDAVSDILHARETVLLPEHRTNVLESFQQAGGIA